VRYRDICADPLAVVREAYQRHGRDLPAGAARSMLAWDEQHPAGAFGTHHYNWRPTA